MTVFQNSMLKFAGAKAAGPTEIVRQVQELPAMETGDDQVSKLW